MVRNKKGQSTLEYVIVLAAIIAAIIVFATGTFKNRLSNSLDDVSNQMQNVIGRIRY
jgi:Flp pilus assembly pilin Flp